MSNSDVCRRDDIHYFSPTSTKEYSTISCHVKFGVFDRLLNEESMVDEEKRENLANARRKLKKFRDQQQPNLPEPNGNKVHPSNGVNLFFLSLLFIIWFFFSHPSIQWHIRTSCKWIQSLKLNKNFCLDHIISRISWMNHNFLSMEFIKAYHNLLLWISKDN